MSGGGSGGSVSFSVPVALAERFRRNLEERGFTERGDFSAEVNRALRLYLDQLGELDGPAEPVEPAVLDFFSEAEDLG